MRIQPVGTHQTPSIAPVVSYYDGGMDELVTQPGIVGWSSFDTIGFAPEQTAIPAVPPVANPQDLALVEEQRRLSPMCPFLGLNQYSGFGIRA